MTHESSRNISAQQAYAWLVSGEAVLIDVREPDEFKAEHIAYALSLPLGHVGTTFTQLNLANRKIIFQCLRGKRGEQACTFLNGQNTSCSAYNIEGGIEGWKAAGLPVISGSGSGLSIFRQVQIIIGTLVGLGVVLGFGGHIWGFAAAGLFGAALALSGLSGWCGLAMLLAKAPWNR